MGEEKQWGPINRELLETGKHREERTGGERIEWKRAAVMLLAFWELIAVVHSSTVKGDRKGYRRI